MKVIIIGSGIIGLTIAIELVNDGHNVTVIEKEPLCGAHASGRNSGVLHSGIYYPKETLKAQFCAQGKPLFIEFCNNNGIQLDQCGKVLVTKNQGECDALQLLANRAKENNISAEWLSESQLAEKNTHAKTVDSALWIAETAVFDPKKVLTTLIQLLNDHPNANVQFNTAFKQRIDDHRILTTAGELSFDHLINSAGGYADKIAHKFNVASHLTLIPFKGLYKKVVPKIASKIKHHIYPVPDLENPFLGVHFTKSVSGDVYAGPTAIPAFGPENYGVFENIGAESVRILAKDATLFVTNKKFRRVALSEPKRYIHSCFYNEAKQLVTALEPNDLVACQKIGIRPQLVDWNTKELVMDFNIQHQDNHTHILNAISPAFTCCFAFAKHVCNKYIN